MCAALDALLPIADVESVGDLKRVVGTLQRAAANRETRCPLVGVVRGDGEFDLRVPPTSVLRSPGSFLCTVRKGLREADASAMGLVLPVRTGLRFRRVGKKHTRAYSPSRDLCGTRSPTGRSETTNRPGTLRHSLE